MLEKFKTKELVTIALFGAVNFLFIFALGTILITITGIPASGGLLSLLIAMLITIVCVKTISKFGVASIMLAITGALAIPTLSFGPPGIHKILMLFLIGLVLDLVITSLGKSRTGYLIAGIVGGTFKKITQHPSL